MNDNNKPRKRKFFWKIPGDVPGWSSQPDRFQSKRSGPNPAYQFIPSIILERIERSFGKKNTQKTEDDSEITFKDSSHVTSNDVESRKQKLLHSEQFADQQHDVTSEDVLKQNLQQGDFESAQPQHSTEEQQPENVLSAADSFSPRSEEKISNVQLISVTEADVRDGVHKPGDTLKLEQDHSVLMQKEDDSTNLAFEHETTQQENDEYLSVNQTDHLSSYKQQPNEGIQADALSAQSTEPKSPVSDQSSEIIIQAEVSAEETQSREQVVNQLHPSGASTVVADNEKVTDENSTSAYYAPGHHGDGMQTLNQQRGRFNYCPLLVLLAFLLGGVGGYWLAASKDENCEQQTVANTPAAPIEKVCANQTETSNNNKVVTITLGEDTKTGNSTLRVIKHVVVRGDTLWDIAETYVKDPFRYPELARLSKIKNPDLIYPDDLVIIHIYE